MFNFWRSKNDAMRRRITSKIYELHNFTWIWEEVNPYCPPSTEAEAKLLSKPYFNEDYITVYDFREVYCFYEWNK